MIEVADDGVGARRPATGSGLRGLADRVAALDGRLDVESPRQRRDAGRRGDPAARGAVHQPAEAAHPRA